MTRPTPWTDEQRLTNPPDGDRESFGLAFERIVGIMARLRGPGGCPWDRDQSLESLRPYLVEESYEVLEAIESGSVEAHREELGDLLLQVVFQSELRREAGEFDAADITHGIADKLVRRHPHVFGDESAKEKGEAFEHWERQKAKEKAGRSAIAGVPRALPALLRSQRVSEKAGRVGFDWSAVAEVRKKVDEEMGELDAAIQSGERAAIEHELGDVLFSLANLARHLEVSAEDSLHATVNRFGARFGAVEAQLRAEGRDMSKESPEVLERMWQAAKAAERK